MTVSAQELTTISILKGVENCDLLEVAHLFVQKKVKAKQALFSSTQTSDDLYFVLSGQFSARSFGADGREVSFGKFSKGEYFAEMGNFEGGAQRVNIEADEDSTVLKLSAENFAILVKKIPQTMPSMMRFQDEIINCLAQRVFEFSTMPVPLRIRRHLLRLSEGADIVENTVLIDPAPSHYEIAVSVSTHREAVSRELSSLSRSGIIDTRRRSIKILDIQRLSGIIESQSQLSSKY